MTREEFVKVCVQNSYQYDGEFVDLVYRSEDGRVALTFDLVDNEFIIVQVDDIWYSSLGCFRTNTWEGVNKFLTLCDYQPLVNLKVQV